MRAAIVAPLILVCAGLGVACEDDDIGKPCGTEASGLPLEPVGGEVPVLEVVRVERDGACESFQCLRHQGIAPYCSRDCEFLETSSNKSCTADGDCSSAEFCVDGQCTDDDCPNGFRCRQVQEVGPLTGRLFCTRLDACSKNLDCEEVGTNVCVSHGCFDSCLMAGSDCDAHTLTCLPEENLPCACPGGTVGDPLTCADEDLVCALETDIEPWASGAIKRQGLCLQRENKK